MSRAGDDAGAKVKTVRVDLGLTQDVFGALLGVHQVTVSRWECGKQRPTCYQMGIIGRFAESEKSKFVISSISGIIISDGAVAGITFLLTQSNVRSSD